MSGIIIMVSGCLGKTHLAKKYTNVIEIESGYYCYHLTKEQLRLGIEKVKGLPDRIPNKEYPVNYVNELINATKKYDIVMSAMCGNIRAELDRRGQKYLVIYSDLNMKNEIIQRSIDRGNNQYYINGIINKYESITQELNALNVPKIVLSGHQYLEDVLLEIGLLKKPHEQENEK